MAIDAAALLSRIASNLQDYGRFETATAPPSFLAQKLQEAMVDIHRKHPWVFIIGQAQLAIQENNRGPYDPPANFGGLVPAKKNVDFYAYDYYGVPNPIGDGPNGRKWPIYWDEVSNKIYFVHAPNNCTNATFTYRKKLSDNPLDDLANWPSEMWLINALDHRTRAYALQPTEEFAAQAQSEMALSESQMNAQIRFIDVRGTRPATREVVGIQGVPHWRRLQGLQH